MYRTLVLATLAGMVAGPAFAAGGSCSTAPKSQFKPKATLEAQLTGEGLTVRQIKVEKGCYEVYAVDKAGKKVNLAYNAETLEKLDNAEAGAAYDQSRQPARNTADDQRRQNAH